VESSPSGSPRGYTQAKAFGYIFEAGKMPALPADGFAVYHSHFGCVSFIRMCYLENGATKPICAPLGMQAEPSG
jgi:hypothetical protein